MKQLLVVSGVLALTACTRVEDERVAPAARKPVESARAPSGIEKLVLDLAPCRLEGYQITSTCPAMEALSAELRHPGTAHELSLSLGSKLLTHRAPSVRLEAAALLGNDAASRDAVVDAARRESDIHVRQAMIRILAADGARFPRVGAFLLDSAQHGSSEIRTQALAALTLPANRELPGATDRVLAMAERDPDPALRQAACRAGGTLGSALWVPFYERVTATSDVPELYAACMEGVVSMFVVPPSSEAAYRLFLRRIREAPSQAPWQVMSAFCYTHEWKQRPAWFDATEVKTVLTAVITDRAASWQARAAAIESMVGLGATRDELKALEAGYSPKDSSDRLVLAKLDSALAE